MRNAKKFECALDEMDRAAAAKVVRTEKEAAARVRDVTSGSRMINPVAERRYAQSVLDTRDRVVAEAKMEAAAVAFLTGYCRSRMPMVAAGLSPEAVMLDASAALRNKQRNDLDERIAGRRVAAMISAAKIARGESKSFLAAAIERMNKERDRSERLSGAA